MARTRSARPGIGSRLIGTILAVVILTIIVVIALFQWVI